MDVQLLLVVALAALASLLAGVLLGLRLAGLRTDLTRAALARGEDQAVIRDGLSRLDERLRDLAGQRSSWQGQLHEQVEAVRRGADDLRRETLALSTALRRPQVRGRWGELHLRRTVEVAGLVDRCDFSEQVHLPGLDGALRPDLVVHLPGDREVVVDAKVPLEAHLDALAAADPEEQAEHLARHARQLRRHVDTLSAKSYTRALPAAADFVVLFVPAEACLSAALEADPALLEYAAAHDVVLATPTTLIALLRTVAQGWTAQTLVERTREIHELARELYDRLGTMGAHLDKLGRSLKGSVEAYNKAVGSLEGRVLVTARHFEDIGVSSGSLGSPRPVEDTPRPLTARELLEEVAEPRPEVEPRLLDAAGHERADRAAGE